MNAINLSGNGSFTILTPTWTTRGTSNYGWVYFHQGGRYDFATGLFAFRRRDYSPTLGRWMENDPIGFGARDTNFYRYVADSPVRGLDPSGLETFPMDFNVHDWPTGIVVGGAVIQWTGDCKTCTCNYDATAQWWGPGLNLSYGSVGIAWSYGGTVNVDVGWEKDPNCEGGKRCVFKVTVQFSYIGGVGYVYTTKPKPYVLYHSCDCKPSAKRCKEIEDAINNLLNPRPSPLDIFKPCKKK
jgi:RHS repeat-associated protein